MKNLLVLIAMTLFINSKASAAVVLVQSECSCVVGTQSAQTAFNVAELTAQGTFLIHDVACMIYTCISDNRCAPKPIPNDGNQTITTSGEEENIKTKTITANTGILHYVPEIIFGAPCEDVFAPTIQ